jgi:hypothetical protein
MAEHLLELFGKTEPSHRGAILLPNHQEVDVAIGAGLPTTNRTKDLQLLGTVLPRESEDIFPMRGDYLLDPKPRTISNGMDLGSVPQFGLASRASSEQRYARRPFVKAPEATNSGENNFHLD